MLRFDNAPKRATNLNVRLPMARARNLNPVFSVGADQVVMDTPALGAVPCSELRKPVPSLGAEREHIQEALDTLFGVY